MRTRSIVQFLVPTLLAAAATIPASHVFASDDAASAYGCSKLEEIPDLEMIEGKDGVFFRVMVDIRMQHAFTDQTVAHLAALSRALEAHGTTLIYVPVPTKTQALPDYAPDNARLYGYDPAIARSVYSDIIDRLNAKGVVAVDVLTSMLKQPKNEFGEFTFFQSDFHWTAYGARIAADAIGSRIRSLPEYAQVSPIEFEVQQSGVEMAFSSMRTLLQTRCKTSVPAVAAHSYRTVRKSKGDAESVDIFGSDQSDSIALVGTSYSDLPIGNFAGFIENASGMLIENYSISGGNQFGSVLSYFTSREFQEKRPRFVIWENPIYNNLGQYGDAPWKEILAAAAGDCGATMAASGDGTTFTVPLNGVKVSENDVFLADAGQEGSRKALFEFVGDDGRIWSKTIARGDRLRSTGRYYASLTGVPDINLKEVRVTYDIPASENSISICKINPGDQS